MGGSYVLIIAPIIWLIIIGIGAGYIGQAAFQDSVTGPNVNNLTSELSQLNGTIEADAGTISFWRGVSFTFGDILPTWAALLFTTIPTLILGVGVWYAFKPGGS